MTWVKSSRSADNGCCVEVAFVKSSYSAENGCCVEVARTPEAVMVRDSKDKDGPVLSFDVAAWRAFVRGVRGA